MNELIQKLANEAEIYADAILDAGGDFHIPYTEKFAELLVRECLGCCEQVISDPVPKSVDTWLNGGSQCIDEIKQHFGVE